MSDPLEMARCVEINIENMVTIMPVLKMHPLLPIVQLQIKECIEALGTDGAGAPTGDICTWTQMDEEGSDWDSSCGDAWFFESGAPKDNNVRFCPFCGRRVEAKFYEPDIEEWDDEELSDVGN